MVQFSLTYRDVTAMAPAETHFPDWVIALENVGFVRLGRVQCVVEPGGIEALADGYEPADRKQMVAADRVPTVVLAAADGSAFADVDWFWGGPSVRIRTLTTDGRLVATHRGWEQMPAVPVDLRPTWRYFSLTQEQLLSAARGRSLEVVAEADATTLWERHRAHLARTGATPEPHDTVADYIRMAERAFSHELHVAERARITTYVALAVWTVGLLAVLALVLPISDVTLRLVAAALLGVVIVWLTQRPVAAWARYLRWVRPRFR